jgi:hypothetical protein
VAFELMRRYETHYGQKSYYLDANGITSLAQLYEQLAFVFRVKPIANEPILLRLKMVLHNEQPYLFIDNVDDEDEFHLRPETLIDQVIAHLPTVRCIITSRKVGVVAQFPNTRNECSLHCKVTISNHRRVNCLCEFLRKRVVNMSNPSMYSNHVERSRVTRC